MILDRVLWWIIATIAGGSTVMALLSVWSVLAGRWPWTVLPGWLLAAIFWDLLAYATAKAAGVRR